MSNILSLILALSAASFSGMLDAQSTDSLSMDLPVRKVSVDPNEFVISALPNSAFGVGEKLTFDIAYGLAKAGKAVMAIPDTVHISGRPCYRIETTAKSTGLVNTFFTVRDTVTTYVDVDGLFPWKFEKHLNEGGYHADRYIDYRQRDGEAIYRKERHKKNKTKVKIDTSAVPRFVQGVLSAFYYIRTQKLEVGKPIEIMAYGDGKLYPLQVLVHKKEKIKVPAGKFKCVVVEPVLMSEGIFKQDGQLTIWLTDDEAKMPVLMKSKVAIGSIDCRLRTYKLAPAKE